MLNRFNFVFLRSLLLWRSLVLFHFSAFSSMLSLVRLQLGRLFLIMPFPSVFFVPPPILLGKVRGFLFLLVGAGFLSIALTACATLDGGSREVDTDGDRRAGSMDTDSDNDGVMDGVDIDDDGDGLIEIATAAELDEIGRAHV